MSKKNLSNKRLNTSQHIIAYIDILGGKKLILEDIMDKNLNEVKEIYDLIQNFIKTLKENSNTFVDFKIFSDNILLTFLPEASNWQNIGSSIYNFFCLLAFIQMKALEKNILLRGGVTIGDICINKTFTWGNGLLRAIELEEKYAIYPRIIIDNSVMSLISNIEHFTTGNFKMLQDIDGWFYIHYLGTYGVTTTYSHLDAIQKHLNYLSIEIQKEYQNSNVLQKLQWQRLYCNGYILPYQQQISLGGLNV